MQIRCVRTLVFEMVVAVPMALTAQTVDTINPEVKARVDRIASQVLEQRGIPSASIAVVEHGKLVYTHAYGDARLAD